MCACPAGGRGWSGCRRSVSATPTRSARERPASVSLPHRVDGWPRVADLVRFELVHAGVLVAPRVGRTGKADLVPGGRVGVERRAGVARPQAPHVLGGQPVPLPPGALLLDRV